MLFWILMTMAYMLVGVLAARLYYVMFSHTDKEARAVSKFVGFLWPVAIIVTIVIGVAVAVWSMFELIGKFVFRETKASALLRVKEEERQAHNVTILMLAETDPDLLTEEDRKAVIAMLEKTRKDSIYNLTEYRRLGDLIHKIRVIDEPEAQRALTGDVLGQSFDELSRSIRTKVAELGPRPGSQVVRTRPKVAPTYRRQFPQFEYETTYGGVDTDGPWA